MTIDVYQQYFAAECTFNGVPRRAVSVKLTSDSYDGTIAYTASVSFFPHTADDDFAVSYDAYAERKLYRAKGRRSKKREATLMESLQSECDALAEQMGGTILWAQPLRDACYA